MQHPQAIVVQAGELALERPAAIATTNGDGCLGVENGQLPPWKKQPRVRKRKNISSPANVHHLLPRQRFLASVNTQQCTITHKHGNNELLGVYLSLVATPLLVWRIWKGFSYWPSDIVQCHCSLKGANETHRDVSCHFSSFTITSYDTNNIALHFLQVRIIYIFIWHR